MPPHPDPTHEQRAGDTPRNDALDRPEAFIPLRIGELIERLAASGIFAEGEADDFRGVCRQLRALLQLDFRRVLEELKEIYAPFDPDSDTRAPHPLGVTETAALREVLFHKFDWLMARGNFLRVNSEQIDAAIADRSHWGINLAVNFQMFEQLAIYYRGDLSGTRFLRRLRSALRSEAVEVPIYQRLIVIFRLRSCPGVKRLLDTDDVYIKLFKDIPQLDLDMLLPGTQVKMSLVDRVRILLPTLSGLSIAVWKIVQGALLVAAAGFYTSLAFLGLIGGTLGYGVRSFFGYLNTKQKYQLNLTQSLYFQNLDNNCGALCRLVDEAEEQEAREAILAYYVLWRLAPEEGWSTAELDHRLERYLLRAAKRAVDFEIDDALAKLQRWSLIEPVADGRWRALPPAAGRKKLAEHLGSFDG